MDRKSYWDAVYSTREPAEVSWYQPLPERSLELIAEAGAGPESAVIDVGGGDSTLVDALLERRLGRITVLDLSAAALQRAKRRLGATAHAVTWLEADVTRAAFPPSGFDVWHDRAVFHFLTDAADRARYVATAAAAVRAGGALIMATFAPDGPLRCSGLEVARYAAPDLARELGDAFELDRGFEDTHRTPSGAEQRFTYALFRRR